MRKKGSDNISSVLSEATRVGLRGLGRLPFAHFALRVSFLRLDQVVTLVGLAMLRLVLVLRAHLQAVLRRAQVFVAAEVVLLLFQQVELLGAKDASRPCNSDPSNERLSSNLIIFHSVKSYQGSCTT